MTFLEHLEQKQMFAFFGPPNMQMFVIGFLKQNQIFVGVFFSFFFSFLAPKYANFDHRTQMTISGKQTGLQFLSSLASKMCKFCNFLVIGDPQIIIFLGGGHFVQNMFYLI